MWYCSEEKTPNFPRELAAVSIPQDGVLPYFKGAMMDPFWPEAGSGKPSDLRRLDDFVLTAHDARRFDDSRLDGKYTLVAFFFARCSGICPLITHNLKKLSKRIPAQNDLQWLSITVNPEEDDAKIIDNYRRTHDITQPNWFFLTGPKITIYQFARDQFGADVQTVGGRDSLTDFVHTENVYLLDREGYLRGMYRARGTGDFDRLLNDLAALQAEDRKSAQSPAIARPAG